MTFTNEYSESEWKTFSTTEKRIILLVKQYGIDDKDRLRMLMNWPAEPMEKQTFAGHWSRILKKVRKIREERRKESIAILSGNAD